MAVASITTISGDVLLEIPDAPTNLILHKLRSVIRDFCERTDAWQVEEAVDTTSALVYVLTPPANSEIRKIISIKDDGRDLSSFVRYKLLPGANSLEFNELTPPQSGNELIVTYSVLPTADDVDAWILTNYKRELVAGAISYLMRMPSRPFTEYNLSMLFNKEYMNGVSRELTRDVNEGKAFSGGFSA